MPGRTAPLPVLPPSSGSGRAPPDLAWRRARFGVCLTWRVFRSFATHSFPCCTDVPAGMWVCGPVGYLFRALPLERRLYRDTPNRRGEGKNNVVNQFDPAPPAPLPSLTTTLVRRAHRLFSLQRVPLGPGNTERIP